MTPGIYEVILYWMVFRSDVGGNAIENGAVQLGHNDELRRPTKNNTR